MGISDGGTYQEVEEQLELARWFVSYVLETRGEWKPEIFLERAGVGYTSVPYGEGNWFTIRDRSSIKINALVFYRPKLRLSERVNLGTVLELLSESEGEKAA
jgi:hypothetical protein